MVKPPKPIPGYQYISRFPLAFSHADKSCSLIFFSVLYLPIATACLFQRCHYNFACEPLQAPVLTLKPQLRQTATGPLNLCATTRNAPISPKPRPCRWTFGVHILSCKHANSCYIDKLNVCMFCAKSTTWSLQPCTSASSVCNFTLRLHGLVTVLALSLLPKPH